MWWYVAPRWYPGRVGWLTKPSMSRAQRSIGRLPWSIADVDIRMTLFSHDHDGSLEQAQRRDGPPGVANDDEHPVPRTCSPTAC